MGRISSSGLESLLRSYASPQRNRGVSRCVGHRSWIAAFPSSPTPRSESRTVSLPLEPCFARRSLDGPSNSHCRLLANPGTRSCQCKQDPCSSSRPFSCHPTTQCACGLPNTRVEVLAGDFRAPPERLHAWSSPFLSFQRSVLAIENCAMTAPCGLYFSSGSRPR